MKIEPASERFGALVYNICLAQISEADFQQVLSWWNKYAVLIFPEQHLSQEEQIAFTRRFGRMERGLSKSNRATAGMISNLDRDGNLLPQSNIGRQFNIGNSVWHTDSSYKRIAAKASLLSAHVVPSSGGQTEWADMRQGYNALDESLKSWLDDKIAVHSYRFSHAWHRGLDILSDEDLEQLPPVEHHIIKEHPATQDKILFVGRHASHIVGEDFNASRKLLRELTFEAAQEPRTWKHYWKVGDIGIWDNRCVLHRARRYPSDEPRAMRRTTVAGDDPTNEWAA
ncbi:MAG: TauD/TfdA family dioxygenase [Gammaproteobacteria bacterium]|nr:TauD/TfdA family dioxygenase [Gammaproteobacteria bacterium]